MGRAPDHVSVDLPSLFPPELGEPPTSWFATWGPGEDRDMAFDVAVDRALQSWGEHLVPALDPAHVRVCGDGVPLTLAQARRVAHDELGDGPVAVPFFLPRSFRRKPVRVAVTDEDLVLPDAGPLAAWDPRLDELLRAGVASVLDAQGWGPATIDTVELVRRQVRSRAVAQRVPGRQRKRFVVLQDERIVAGFDTAREARAHAVGLARADERDEADWEVAALVGRDTEDGWQPLVHVRRRRRTHKGVFRVMTVQPRENPGRLGGWVFATDEMPGA